MISTSIEQLSALENAIYKEGFQGLMDTSKTEDIVSFPDLIEKELKNLEILNKEKSRLVKMFHAISTELSK
jgi:hypothetical protein